MTNKPNIINGCSILRNLVCLIGLPGAWSFQDVGDDKLFLKLVKTQINDIFLQHLHTRVDCLSRAFFINMSLNLNFNIF